MTDYFQTQNATVLSFVPYTGGKFLSNCLALSRYACPQHTLAADYLLRHPDDYDFRLRIVSESLPPPDKMISWRDFEYGDQQIYGHAFGAWIAGVAAEPNDITKKLCISDMRFFVTNHGVAPINLGRIWKNATIIKLINSRKFQDLCLSKKVEKPKTDRSQYNGNYCEEKYSILRDPDWPSWQEFEKSGHDVRNFPTLNTRTSEKIAEFYHLLPANNQVLLFDVDSYFDIHRFMRSIKQLYQNLNFTDFQPDLVEYFYKQYADLHF